MSSVFIAGDTMFGKYFRTVYVIFLFYHFRYVVMALFYFIFFRRLEDKSVKRGKEDDK